MNKGTIVITLEGISFEETERYRQMVHILFQSGVFGIRNGKAILNFDHEGMLAEIELQVKRWRRDKPMSETKVLEQFKIETLPIEQTTIAKRI